MHNTVSFPPASCSRQSQTRSGQTQHHEHLQHNSPKQPPTEKAAPFNKSMEQNMRSAVTYVGSLASKQPNSQTLRVTKRRQYPACKGEMSPDLLLAVLLAVSILVRASAASTGGGAHLCPACCLWGDCGAVWVRPTGHKLTSLNCHFTDPMSH